MSTKAISRGVVSAGVWTAAKLVASAAFTPLLARLLGAEGYGQYAYYTAVILMATPFANLGTAHILAKYIAERPDEAKWHSDIVFFAATLNSFGALLTGILVAVLITPSLIAAPGTILITTLVVGAITIGQVTLFSRGILNGLRREMLANLPAAIGAVLSPALGVIFAAIGAGLMGVILGILTADMFVALITLRYVNRLVNWQWQAHKLLNLPVRTFMSFGLFSTLFSVMSMAHYKADVVLLRHLAGDFEVGLYRAAVQWSEFVWIVPIAIQAVMLQSTSKLWAENRLDEIARLLNRLLRYVSLGTAFLLIIVCVFSDRLIAIYYGPEFVGASWALRLITPGVFGFSLSRVMWPVIQARGDIVSLAKTTLLATAANLALNWLLIPPWGAIGAAVASAVSYGGVTFAYAALFHRWGIYPLKNLGWSRLVFLIVTTTLVLIPLEVFVRSTPVTLLLGGLTATTVYWAGALRLGLITVAEIRQINNSLPASVRKPGAFILQILEPVLTQFEIRGFRKP